MKKLISILLSLVILLTSCTVGTSGVFAADSTVTDGKYRYEYTDETHTALRILGRGKYSGGVIEIPDEVEGLPVTEVAERAFAGGTTLSSVTFGKNIEIIGANAFQTGYYESIDLSQTKVKEIGSYAFMFSKLKSLKLSPCLERIENGAFSGISEKLSVDFPNTVKYIAGNAFSSLDTDDDEFYIVGDGVLLGYNEKSEEKHSVTLPSTVKSLSGAFAGTKAPLVTELTINDECEAICAEALAYNKTLKSVHIGNGVKEIGSNAMREMNITTADGGSNVEKIGNYAFYDDILLTSFDMSSVKSFGECAFKHSGIKAAVIQPSAESFGKGVFMQCTSLLSVDFGGNMSVIPAEMFKGCGALNEFKGYENITDVSYGAFSNCTGLKAVPFSTQLVTIGTNAFSGCIWLKSIKLGKDLKSIDSAFNGASFLEDADLSECINLEEIKGNVFENTNIKSADFSKLTKVTSLASTFTNCNSLTEVKLPNSITLIGASTFKNCELLKSVEMSDKITAIGNSAFSGCSSLTSLELPETLKTIGAWAFDGCYNLKDMTVPESVTSLGESTFRNCSKLTGLYVLSSLTKVPSACFMNTPITEAILPSKTTAVNSDAFSGCKNLTKVEFNDGLKSIGASAFEGCSIEKINIPASVTVISERAFLSPAVEPSELTVAEGNTAFRIYQHSIYSKDLKRLVQYFNKNDEVYVIPDETTKVCASYETSAIVGNAKIIIPEKLNSSAFTRLANAFTSGSTLYVTDKSTIWDNFSNNPSYYSTKNIIGSNTASLRMKDVENIECGVNDNKPAVTVYDSENGEKTLAEGTDYLLYYYGNKSVGKNGVAYAIGINDYEGMAASANFSVTSNDLKYADLTLEKTSYDYDGSAVVPAFTVKLFDRELEENTDFDVVLTDNEKTGTATLTLNGKGDYIGTVSKKFKIVCNHDYDIEEVQASCTEPEGIKYTCKICGAVNYDIYSPSLGHDFEKTVIAPTCQNMGHVKEVCRRCGYIYERDLEKTAHSYNTVDIYYPVCTEEGYCIDECTYCGERRTRVIPAREHRFAAEEHEVNCYQDGCTVYTCLDCFYSYTEVHEKADPKYHKKKTRYVKPTCSGDGYYYCECTVCGNVLADEILPATPHKWSEWTVDDSDGNCGYNLKKWRHCKVCGAEEEGVSKATGKHDWDKNYTFPASTKENGCSFVTCKECGKFKYYHYIWRVETFELKKANFEYDGRKHKPKVVIKDYQGGVVDPKNYKVTYEKNPTSIGKHKVKIKFIGKRYEGGATLTYNINPKNTKLKSLSGVNGGFKAIIKKEKSTADGYQLQYSKNKKKLKKGKKITLDGKNNTSIKVNSLESGTEYFVRVRTYKIVNGRKLYSAWSKAKKVNTK